MIFFVADDDRSTQTLCRLILKRLTVAQEIHLASNGQQLLEQLEASDPAVRKIVLLDLNMPVMDGAQFVGELEKSTLSQVEVYLMLTNRLKDNEQYLRDSPFVRGTLDKPLDGEKIQSIL